MYIPAVFIWFMGEWYRNVGGLMAIGKLKEVNLRELWRHEQYDFSSWLAEEQNIEELNKVLGVSLTDIETEKAVGSFRCDLLGKDEMSGKVVLIENQLEPTNHDHLGKIITYGSVLDAAVIVWIVEYARPEHRSAIEWLNSHLDGDVSFFLIEVHTYKIGNSDPAPMFTIIEQPNDFVTGVKAVEKNGMNESQSRRLEFWNQFNEVLESKGCPFNKRKATTDHWYDVSVGSSLCHLSINLVNKDNKIRICMYINDNKAKYDEFYSHKDDIEGALGYELEWRRMDDAKASMISTYIEKLDFENHDNYPELMNESISKILEFKKAFKKYI